MSENEQEYKAEIRWYEHCDEDGIPQSLTDECRIRVFRTEDDYELFEFYVPVTGDPTELLDHLDPALRSQGWERTGDLNSWWSESVDDEIDGSPADGTFPVRPLAPGAGPGAVSLYEDNAGGLYLVADRDDEHAWTGIERTNSTFAADAKAIREGDTRGWTAPREPLPMFGTLLASIEQGELTIPNRQRLHRTAESATLDYVGAVKSWRVAWDDQNGPEEQWRIASFPTYREAEDYVRTRYAQGQPLTRYGTSEDERPIYGWCGCDPACSVHPDDMCPYVIIEPIWATIRSDEE